jgi:predicted ester cyclase
MADEAKETVRRVFDEVLNKGRLDLVDELLAPTFITHTPQGDLKGRAGFRSYVEAWRAAFPDVRCEVLDVIQEGDRVAWRVRSTGTHKGDEFGVAATGSSVDFESMHHGHTRDGKLVEHWIMMDIGAVFDQLGRGT